MRRERGGGGRADIGGKGREYGWNEEGEEERT
jgi:hypothetical protein